METYELPSANNLKLMRSESDIAGYVVPSVNH
jgi:hypothetical protein